MNGKKTYIVAAFMILHALSAYILGHDQPLNIQEILAALGLSALRAGVKKAEHDDSPPWGNPSSFIIGALCSLYVHAASAAADPGSGLTGGASVLGSRQSRTALCSLCVYSTPAAEHSSEKVGKPVRENPTYSLTGSLTYNSKNIGVSKPPRAPLPKAHSMPTCAAIMAMCSTVECAFGSSSKRQGIKASES